MIGEYFILYRNTAPDLSADVYKCIKVGWQPYGSPYYASGEFEGLHCQAMVKEVSVETFNKGVR